MTPTETWKLRRTAFVFFLVLYCLQSKINSIIHLPLLYRNRVFYCMFHFSGNGFSLNQSRYLPWQLIFASLIIYFQFYERPVNNLRVYLLLISLYDIMKLCCLNQRVDFVANCYYYQLKERNQKIHYKYASKEENLTNLMLAIILLTNSMQVGQWANLASILQKLHFFDIDDYFYICNSKKLI